MHGVHEAHSKRFRSLGAKRYDLEPFSELSDAN